jgi:hypothetical protein
LPPTPSGDFLCELCEIVCDLCGQKLLIAEFRKHKGHAKDAKKTVPSPPQPGIPKGQSGRKPDFLIIGRYERQRRFNLSFLVLILRLSHSPPPASAIILQPRGVPSTRQKLMYNRPSSPLQKTAGWSVRAARDCRSKAALSLTVLLAVAVSFWARSGRQPATIEHTVIITSGESHLR